MRVARILATLVAVAALAAGCGGSPAVQPASQTTPHSGSQPAVAAQAASVRDGTIGGQRYVLARPRHPRAGRVVLYMHGAGSNATHAVDDPRLGSLTAALLAAGYAVAASDAHGDNWGDDPSVADQVALAHHLATLGLDRVYVLAESMGGLDALRLIGQVPVRAWAGLYPVCNLASIDAVGTYSAAIRAANGGTVPPSLSPVRPAPLHGLPMRFWASPSDSVVPKAQNTDVCAANATADGAQVTLTATTGDHGDASNFDPYGLVGFFDVH